MSSGPNLEELPPELLLHICSFLEAGFLVRVLSKVSDVFHNLIHDESTWKARYLDRWKKRNFAIKEKIDNWMDTCIEREEQQLLWRNVETKMQTRVLPEIHFGFVDTVHILEEGLFGVTASRDGSFGIWSFEKLIDGREDDLLGHHQPGAHEGWISCLDSFDQKLFTGGWDKAIRGWDMSSFSSWEATRATTAVLCMTHAEKCLCIGSFGHIMVLDTRLSGSSATKYKYHKRPVLCLAADEKYIISGSEDKSVVVHDRVAGKMFTKFQLEDYPRCFSYDGESLWLGDRGGNVRVFKPAEDKMLKEFPSLHKSLITGIDRSLGSLITCSTDRTIRAFEPTWDVDLVPMAVQQTKFDNSYIAKHKNILMVASASFSAEIWFPTQVDEYTCLASTRSNF